MSTSTWENMKAALPGASSELPSYADSGASPPAWGTPADVDAAMNDDGWNADPSAEGGEDELSRPSYVPAGITKTPGEHGWADNKTAAYDYEVYNKTAKELAAAQGEVDDEAAAEVQAYMPEDIGAVGGLMPGQFGSNAAVYEWKEEYGDVGPEFPELEKQLFGSANHVKAGIRFDQVACLEVVQEGSIRIVPIADFESAGLHPVMLENVKKAGYDVPTPIQRYCLPAVFKGHDVIACAQTGSGKTAAYLIPTLSKLMGKAKKLAAPRPNPATFDPSLHQAVRAEPLILIVSPTRELATQIFDEARRFCYRTMLRPCVIYGGTPIADQLNQIAKGCDVLIGTPGRLCDFINRPHALTLKRLKYMIIDEADELITSDWESEMKQIMSGGDQEEGNINYLMFSATFPKMARELALTHLHHDHIKIRVGRAGSTHSNIKQEIIYVEASMKRTALFDLLMSAPPARTLIFVNSKRTADEVDDFLFNRQIPCTSIHSDRTQREREDSLRAFRSGKAPVLIATGVSARGLDIHHIAHVINYDLPSTQHGGIDEYTHRIGRTGRIGNTGIASSFYNDRDSDIAEVLVKTLLETHQAIPDFLTGYIPEGYEDGKGDVKELRFEEEDEEEGGADAGGGWGTEGAADASGSGWGAPAEAAAPVAAHWGDTPIPAGWQEGPPRDHDTAPVAATTGDGSWGSGTQATGG
ncbi:ATP-dependent RNA helicase ded1, partial [Lachnellula suecica]